MALPDFFRLSQSATSKTWTSSGGDYALTMTSKLTGTARAGAKGDLGEKWSRRWLVLVETKVQVAPTDGLELEAYWAPSTSATAGTDNPGGLDGTDADVTGFDARKAQLLPIGEVPMVNAIGTGAQRKYFLFTPPARYGFPLLINKTGQTVSATGTDTRVVFLQIDETVEE